MSVKEIVEVEEMTGLHTVCPSCGSGNAVCIGKIPPSNRFAGRELARVLCGGYLYRCNSCHLCFRWPRYSKEQLDALYQKGDADNWEYTPENRTDWRLAAAWLSAAPVERRILDVGCSGGGFLEYLGDGWQADGIEINEVAALHAEDRGIQIVARDFAKMGDLDARYGAVVAMDVVEHTWDPMQFLEQMAALTRPGGLIILSTGNTQALSWRLMGSRYWYCAIPEHISFINEQWCYHNAEVLHLHVEHVRGFSRMGRPTPSRVVLDVAKNLFYRFAPSLTGMLRRMGFGGINVSRYQELAQYPPSWASSRDHLVVAFKKH